MKLRALTLSLVFLMEHDTVSVWERRIILRVSITTRKKNSCHSFTSHYIPIWTTALFTWFGAITSHTIPTGEMPNLESLQLLLCLVTSAVLCFSDGQWYPTKCVLHSLFCQWFKAIFDQSVYSLGYIFPRNRPWQVWQGDLEGYLTFPPSHHLSWSFSRSWALFCSQCLNSCLRCAKVVRPSTKRLSPPKGNKNKSVKLIGKK